MNKIRPNASIYLDFGEDGRDCHRRISFKCPNCNKRIREKDIACTECGTAFDWSKKARIKVVRTVEWI